MAVAVIRARAPAGPCPRQKVRLMAAGRPKAAIVPSTAWTTSAAVIVPYCSGSTMRVRIGIVRIPAPSWMAVAIV